MNNDSFNINISIDKRSVQLCIDNKFYKILNSTDEKDTFQMVGTHIMNLVDSLDDILKYREIKAHKLDELTYKKTIAFSHLLAKLILPERKDRALEKFIKSDIAQQTFNTIASLHNNMNTKTIKPFSEINRERMKHSEASSKSNTDIDVEESLKELREETRNKPAVLAKIVKEIKTSIIENPAKESSRTIAEEIKESTKPIFSFDQQYLIDCYKQKFGNTKVSRAKYYQGGGSSRFLKFFKGYSDFVSSAIL